MSRKIVAVPIFDIKNLDVAVILIDGKRLADYMIENELGVTLKQNYKIHSIDSDYFMEE